LGLNVYTCGCTGNKKYCVYHNRKVSASLSDTFFCKDRAKSKIRIGKPFAFKEKSKSTFDLAFLRQADSVKNYKQSKVLLKSGGAAVCVCSPIKLARTLTNTRRAGFKHFVIKEGLLITPHSYTARELASMNRPELKALNIHEYHPMCIVFFGSCSYPDSKVIYLGSHALFEQSIIETMEAFKILALNATSMRPLVAAEAMKRSIIFTTDYEFEIGKIPRDLPYNNYKG